MITVPAGVRIHLALGATDMRKGLGSLLLMVQEMLRQAPFSGHLFIFRGKRSNKIKILFYDQNGMCLFMKRLDQGIRSTAMPASRHWRPKAWSPSQLVASLIETAKLNGVEPYVWLCDSLTQMLNGHPANRLDALMRWMST